MKIKNSSGNAISSASSFRKIILMIGCIGLTACTTAQDQSRHADYNDPLEPFNRAVFNLNDTLDKAIGKPIAKGYRAVVPKPARKGIRNVLRNLRSPVNIVNQLLQGDMEGFAGDTVRALVNTTLGIGGLLDIADSAGIPYEHEDFGQTLAVWGIGHGPYLVLPVIGPNSVRDHTGITLDAYADPLRLYLFNTEQEEWYYGRMVITGIDKREELLETLDDLREGALDYYAAFRSAHYQHREALVRDNEQNPVIPEIPDYEDEEEDIE
jgi:phospholipid-binding lipoprotein MlaA